MSILRGGEFLFCDLTAGLDEKVLPVLPAFLTLYLSLYPIFSPVWDDLMLLTQAVAMYAMNP